jgi:prophage regulatory protein
MRLLGYTDLKAKGIPYCRSQLWRLVKAEEFPRPVKIGANRTRNAWIEAEVDNWMADRVHDRDATLAQAA